MNNKTLPPPGYRHSVSCIVAPAQAPVTETASGRTDDHKPLPGQTTDLVSAVRRSHRLGSLFAWIVIATTIGNVMPSYAQSDGSIDNNEIPVMTSEEGENRSDLQVMRGLFDDGLTALNMAMSPDLDLTESQRIELADEAIAIFHQMLIQDPQLVRVRLELARAFFFKGEDGLATEHFELVLAGDLPPEVIQNVNSFLQVMRARRQWTADFSLAFIPDTNVGAAPASDTIWLLTPFGLLPFTLEGDTTPKSGIGISMAASGEYQFPIRPKIRLRAGANGIVREYAGSLHDSRIIAAYLGPRISLLPRTEASILATIRRDWDANVPVNDDYGVRLEVAHRINDRLLLDASTELVERDCIDCDWRDGHRFDVGATLSFVATPTLRLYGGATVSRMNAESEPYSYTGNIFQVGATTLLPNGFTINLRASLGQTDYEPPGSNHFTIDLEPRSDTTRRYSASVYNRGFTIEGFSPQLTVNFEERVSNAQLANYERTFAEFALVKQF